MLSFWQKCTHKLALLSTQPSCRTPSPVLPFLEAHPLFRPSLHNVLSTRTRLINSLCSWQFEPYRLAPDDLLLCTIIIFESLLTLSNLPPSLSSLSLENQLIPFLSQLRTLHRSSNRYHSFTHAVDVLQALYYFLTRAGVVPPLWRERGQTWDRTDREQEGSLTYLLKDEDVFLLCLAAIGHDVGHPGNSNAFLVSLSKRFLKRVGADMVSIRCRKMYRPRYQGSSSTNLRSSVCTVRSSSDSSLGTACDILSTRARLRDAKGGGSSWARSLRPIWGGTSSGSSGSSEACGSANPESARSLVGVYSPTAGPLVERLWRLKSLHLRKQSGKTGCSSVRH
jgi:hypothetical protein